MHGLIQRQWLAEAKTTVLTRFRLNGGGMVMAFRPGMREPAWVAKRAESERARTRLKQEKSALEWLLPWQETLRIPRLLAWEEGPTESCLVISGVSGASKNQVLQPAAPLDFSFALAGGWLQRLHRLVPSPRPVGINTLQEAWSRQAQNLPEKERRSVGLWAHLQRLPVPARQAVPVHDDFWFGNLLFSGDTVGVIDWNGFHAGTPLDDLLTLLFKTPARSRWRLLGSEAAFRAIFFEPTSAHRFLQAWARECGLTQAESCFCFYSFLARRLHWELGLSLQTRSEREQEQARRSWSPILGWLAESRYPDPFAALP